MSKSLSFAVLCLLYGKAVAIDLPLNNNFAKVQDNSFLDMDVG